MRILLSLVLVFVFNCAVRAQSDSSSSNSLPDNPVAKPMDLEKGSLKASTDGSGPAPVTPGDANGRTHKLKLTTKLWLASSLAVYTAAALDMHATEETVQRVNQLHKEYPWFPEDYSFEADPLARPFLKLPAAAYYACGVALATGVNWLGLRMSRSKRFRKVWWLPQALSVAGNAHGYMTYQ